MRLWSLHPQYLDPQGLVALWREGLLAKKVLEGRTKGYQHHPQLLRFSRSHDPLCQINRFLGQVHLESVKRGYQFDARKIENVPMDAFDRIGVSRKQAEYEFLFLQSKLKERNPAQYERNRARGSLEVNGVFLLTDGEIEEWEKVKAFEGP